MMNYGNNPEHCYMSTGVLKRPFVDERFSYD